MSSTTRNMVTGASTADLAVILVDARKGILTQTRRHSFLVSLLGIRKIVLAVNKMDLVSYSQEVFHAIERDYRLFARQIALEDIVCIPVSAVVGDNITASSLRTPWYSGPRLLEYLETVQVESGEGGAGEGGAGAGGAGEFRMPVQWVNSPGRGFFAVLPA